MDHKEREGVGSARYILAVAARVGVQHPNFRRFSGLRVFATSEFWGVVGLGEMVSVGIVGSNWHVGLGLV